MKTNMDPSLLLSQGASVPGPRSRRDSPEALRKVCQDFEAILTQSLFKGMRATVPEGGLIERSQGTEIFEEMMDIELAKQATQKQGLGIAEVLYRQISKESF